MKFLSQDFFSKCYQIRSFLQIWSHLLKKFLMENIIFCAMTITNVHDFRGHVIAGIYTDESSHGLAFLENGKMRLT